MKLYLKEHENLNLLLILILNLVFTQLVFSLFSLIWHRGINGYFIEDFDDVWYPKIFIGNAIKPFNLISAEKDVNCLYYLYHNHLVQYSAILTVTVSCKMNFQSFPFDTHECVLDLKNWIGETYRVDNFQDFLIT